MRRIIQDQAVILKDRIGRQSRKLIFDQRGEFVGTIGWMAVISVALVLAHGLIKGWLPTFIQDVFTRMETLV